MQSVPLKVQSVPSVFLFLSDRANNYSREKHLKKKITIKEVRHEQESKDGGRICIQERRNYGELLCIC